MIKQFFKFSTISLAILFALTSCDDSDDPAPVPKGDFDFGYLISNEGNFGTPNGSVTFIDSELMQETNEVFQTVNGRELGDVIQSMSFDDDYAFIVANNSNKVEVVNRYSFENIATITDSLKQPRYAVVENDKLYVTNAISKSVEVFSDTSFAHLTTIAIGKTVEEIEEDNDFIYVMNAAYGSGNTITVIDSNTDTVVKDITVGDGLNSIEIEDGILYALHKTGITKTSTSTNEIIGEISFEGGLDRAKHLEVEDGFIYFISGAKIFKYNKDVTSLANAELIDTQLTGGFGLGYGFGVVDNKIFYMDAKGFTENSEVTVYDFDGNLLKTFDAGIGANGVYDND